MSCETRKTLLLVEDDAIIAVCEQIALSRKGYDVVITNSGEGAVDIFRTQSRVDLVLMDIDLGSGMDGTETAKEILKTHDIPIVFLSNHTEPEIVEKTEKITSYGYVVKNSGITVLDASIKMAFKLFEANKKIVESEAKQKAMIAGISDVIGIINEQGIISYSSPNSEKWFGWQVSDLVGVNGLEMVHPDDRERISEELSDLVSKPGSATTVEYLLRCKNGIYRQIELTATNMLQDPVILGILLNYRDITERRLAEETLRISESRLARAEKVARIGNWALLLDSRTMICSNGANAIYGIEGNNAQLSTVQKIPLPEYRAELDAALTDLIMHGKPYDLEFKIRRPSDGQILDIHSIAEYEKKTNTIFGVILDISERKSIETSLKESEYFFRESQRAAFVGSYKIDFAQGTWVSSEVMDSIIGIDKNHSRTIRDWQNIVHPDDRAMLDEYLAKELISQKKTFSKEYRIINQRTNEERWVKVLGSAAFDTKGSIITLIGTIQDITAQKMTEFELKTKNEELEALNEEMQATLEEMEATNEELIATSDELRIKEKTIIREKNFTEALLESLPGYLYVYDQQGKLIRWNKKHEEMTGYSAEELSRMTLADWFDGDDAIRVADAVADIFKTGYGEVEAHLKIKGGKKILIRSNGVPLTIDGKTYFTGVGIDITEQKRASEEREKLLEQLHITQRMDAIGQLAGGVAHDFNNMLAGIMGAAELLSNKNISPEQRTDYVNIIMTAAARAGELTGKLLAFSRKGNKSSTAIDLTKIINDSISILTRTVDKKIVITYENTAKHTTVVGDDAMLQNVFMNIGINASHAMTDGGTLAFTVRNTVLSEEFCRTSQNRIEPGDFIEVEIADTGSGMDDETLAHIFEPFFTTKEPGKGTGLGLSVAYGTIQDHKGIINAHSSPGKGAVFHVYLPLSEGDTAETKETEVITGSGTILLVDDEELIRITARRMLESMGYTVLTANNGAEGIRIFSESHEKISLVILDMVMPVMGGRETFEQMREIDSKVKVIISSGFSKGDSMAEMKKNGISGFIRKPFRQAELSKIVAESIELLNAE
jgi:PAS domain S-box-containing protein